MDDPARQPQVDPEPAALPDPSAPPHNGSLPDPAAAADSPAHAAVESPPPTAETVPLTPDTTAPALPTEAPVDPTGGHSHDEGHDHNTNTRVGPKAPLPSTGVVADGVPVAVVLETIRAFESNSRYDAAPNAAGASGAYQYIPSRWAGYGGYAEAYLSPPEVQDARAAADVEAILATYGDVSMVPIAWYFPLAATDPSWMDRVPNPTGGNTLTVRQYQSKWLDVYVEKLTAYAPVPSLPDSRAGDIRSIAFPVLGPVTYSNDWGACRDGCTRHHEGNDIIGVRMQPLLAVTDGVVSRVRYENAGKAGAIITVTDADGWSYNYFHVNNDTPGSDDGAAGPEWQVSPYISVGTPVAAGEIIGYMGDSGNSEGSVPHLHFEIRRPGGTPVNPHPSLIAAQQRQQCSIGLGPWSTNVADNADPAAPGIRITPLFGEGAWYIDAVGRVTATGDAALIRPGRSNPCPPGPSTPFGTGGGPAAVPPGGLPTIPNEAPAEPSVVPDEAAIAIVVTDPTTGFIQGFTQLRAAAGEAMLGSEGGRGNRTGVAVSTRH